MEITRTAKSKNLYSLPPLLWNFTSTVVDFGVWFYKASIEMEMNYNHTFFLAKKKIKTEMSVVEIPLRRLNIQNSSQSCGNSKKNNNFLEFHRHIIGLLQTKDQRSVAATDFQLF
uniref:Uncharacterized protein n=1 Tax=Glossina pallidipes TaxID=7398 RepID=A0A1B0A608_GLOPL